MPLLPFRLLLSELELLTDRLLLVGNLEPLLEDRDRLVGTPGEPQRLPEVEERVRVVEVARSGREGIDRPLQDRDGLVVAPLIHELEALCVQVGAARPLGGLLLRRRGRGRLLRLRLLLRLGLLLRLALL